MIEYTRGSHCYQLWSPLIWTVIVSRDVRFDENNSCKDNEQNVEIDDKTCDEKLVSSGELERPIERTKENSAENSWSLWEEPETEHLKMRTWGLTGAVLRETYSQRMTIKSSKKSNFVRIEPEKHLGLGGKL